MLIPTKIKLTLMICGFIFITVSCQRTDSSQQKIETSTMNNSLETSNIDHSEPWLAALISEYLQDDAPTNITWKSISSGYNHTCGIVSNNNAYCWGRGPLGNSSVSTSSSPVTVDSNLGLTWKALATGDAHTCGIANNNKAYCWGDGQYGQLGIGNGDFTYRNTPSEVHPSGGLTWKSIVIKANRTCGITTNDKGYCWGLDYTDSSLGLNVNITKSIPTEVNPSSELTWKSISVASTRICGISMDDKAYCWSGPHNEFDTSGSYIPTEISPTGRTWKTISAGGGSFFEGHICAVASDDKGYCWGAGVSGQLGIADGDYSDKSVPTEINPSAGLTWKNIVTGANHTCGITLENDAYCWGTARFAQLGIPNDGDTDKSIPTQVNPVSYEWQQIAPTGFHTCGVTVESKAYCWGFGESGQLGIGPVSSDQEDPASRIYIPREVITPVN